MRLRVTDHYTQRQNIAEAGQRDLLRTHRHAVDATNSPSYVWDHSMELQASIHSSTALDIHTLEGEVPATYISGNTHDISNLAEFSWYDWVYFITLCKIINKIIACYIGPGFFCV